jgi:hypothetical protein
VPKAYTLVLMLQLRDGVIEVGKGSHCG